MSSPGIQGPNAAPEVDPEVAPEAAPETKPGLLTISFKDTSAVPLKFRVKQSLSFETIFKVYEDKKGVEMGAFKYLKDGEILARSSNPLDSGMQDNDQIDVVVMQTGGS
jgi:hypothetical protein